MTPEMMTIDNDLAACGSPVENDILKKLDIITKELFNLKNELNELKGDKRIKYSAPAPVIKDSPKKDKTKVPLATYYTLERKIRDNLDGTVELEFVGKFPRIQDVADHLGFKLGKTFNIYQKKCKLAKEIIITKVEV